ncbi:MAG: hypothetical protein IPM00_09200 [Tetrasphaera sp.]|nr:hypothetical protein [Tetrasphaera sp.]
MKYDKVAVAHAMPLTYAASVPAQPILGDDLDSTIPAELRSWLVRLRLLEGVPFANLVADTELLPAESMRWFYLDRRWTDALVQGALSVGTVNSDDRTHLTAQYPAIRDELDVEERNHRRAEGSARFGGRVEAVSGFILRSEAVSGWPGLHVRAFSVDPEESDDATYLETDPRRMRLLRLERLAPAVLFCLFDGIPKVVHVEEPRQGVQFGFHYAPGGTGRPGHALPSGQDHLQLHQHGRRRARRPEGSRRRDRGALPCRARNQRGRRHPAPRTDPQDEPEDQVRHRG